MLFYYYFLWQYSGELFLDPFNKAVWGCSKWENIHFPAVVLELFSSPLYVKYQLGSILSSESKSYPWVSKQPPNLSPLPAPVLTSVQRLPSCGSFWSSTQVVFAVSSSLCSEPASGCPPMLLAHSCCLSLLSFWSHWILIFLTTLRMFVSQPFCLLFLKYSHLPFHLKKKKQKPKNKTPNLQKSWKNSIVNTHVHLDSPINAFTFALSSCLLPYKYWMTVFVCLFVEPFQSNLQTFRHFTPKYSNINLLKTRAFSFITIMSLHHHYTPKLNLTIVISDMQSIWNFSNYSQSSLELHL